MVHSRRHFVRLGQALLAVAALPAKSFSVTPQSALSDAEARRLFSKESFQPLVNSVFAVRSDSGARSWLTLLSVEDLVVKPAAYQPAMAVQPKAPYSQPAMESFALHFYGTGDPLSQGTYELEHGSLGRFELFIVAPGHSNYTAVINRLVHPVPGMEPPIRRSVVAPESR
jgi:hypothetical protein